MTAERDNLSIQLNELQQQSQEWANKLKESNEEQISSLKETEQFKQQLHENEKELHHLNTELITCQQRCAELHTHNERLANTEREHMLRINELTQELEETHNRMRSEQSFAEKEQKIHELQINLTTIKSEEVVRRKMLLNEKDDLLTRNQQLTFENDELRGKVKKDRKSRRYSTHDETRMSMFSQICDLNTQTVETQTCPTETVCSCSEMDAKIKVLERELRIKECQVGGLNMKLEHHPMLSANVELRKELKKYELELHNQRMEIVSLRSQTRARTVIKSECAVCMERQNCVPVSREQQTDAEPNKVINMSSCNGSALITEEQNYALKAELIKISNKYEITKQICRNRAAEIEKLQQQLASGAMTSLANESPEIENLKVI